MKLIADSRLQIAPPLDDTDQIPSDVETLKRNDDRLVIITEQKSVISEFLYPMLSVPFDTLTVLLNEHFLGYTEKTSLVMNPNGRINDNRPSNLAPSTLTLVCSYFCFIRKEP